MNNPLFSVILPIYNQSEHLDSLVTKYIDGLKEFDDSYELLFIVNGSKDDSYEKLRHLVKSELNIKVYNIEKGGWGRAVKYGISVSSGKYICYTNSARTQLVDLIKVLNLAKLNEGSLIKATRIIRNNLVRKIGSVLYNFEMRLLFGIPIFDVNGTPKVLPKKCLDSMEILSEDDTIDAEIVVRCNIQNIPILEVPISMTTRLSGNSTTNLYSAWNMYVGLIRLKMNLRNTNRKAEIWESQTVALRNPLNLLSGGELKNNGLVPESLDYIVEESFVRIVEKLGITLLVTREYEHLVMGLTVVNGLMNQTYLHLPHPSGLVVDRNKQVMYVAATRNPNQIWELKPSKGFLDRPDYSGNLPHGQPLMPARTKFFAGAHYFHDLAIIGHDLYANSVGQNAIVKIDFNSDKTDPPVWWPKSLESTDSKPRIQRNYLQLNSIAAGSSLENSFFSASSEMIRDTRPGDIDFPVDKNGVIFSGQTREVYGVGLTRPHSARLHNGLLWVDNSGYGEVGYIEHGKFLPVVKLPGWTRGLCFKEGIMFVGLSRVLPKFQMYAPGLDPGVATICGIYAISVATGEVIGSIRWPLANQIFSIDYIESSISTGFANGKFDFEEKTVHDLFYGFTT